MARNLVTIKNVVNDFLLSLSEDDYVSNATDYHVHNLALRGAREMGFDIMKRIKSVRMEVDKTLNTVDLPDDFVDFLRIGAVGSDGLFYAFKENKHINIAQTYVLDSNNNPIDSDGDGVYDREDARNVTRSGSNTNDTADNFINARYLYDATEGKFYGYGGAKAMGEFRINHEQNRIELPTASIDEYVWVEYIADIARENNPHIHVYTEEALRQYIYMLLIERKSNVPAIEKQRARQEYFNEFRRAKARLNSFSKEEAMFVIRKNTKQSPKL